MSPAYYRDGEGVVVFASEKESIELPPKRSSIGAVQFGLPHDQPAPAVYRA